MQTYTRDQLRPVKTKLGLWWMMIMKICEVQQRKVMNLSNIKDKSAHISVVNIKEKAGEGMVVRFTNRSRIFCFGFLVFRHDCLMNPAKKS